MIQYDQETKLFEKNILRLVPVQVEVKLENYNHVVKQIVIGGRVKNFPVSFSSNSSIPILPASSLGKLVVLHYHNKFHKEPDTIVAHTRSDVWVVSCRKIASNIDSRCRICKVARKQRASQVMVNLSPLRSDDTAPAWSAVNMDLFGPFYIRDECVKR